MPAGANAGSLPAAAQEEASDRDEQPNKYADDRGEIGAAGSPCSPVGWQTGYCDLEVEPAPPSRPGRSLSTSRRSGGPPQAHRRPKRDPFLARVRATVCAGHAAFASRMLRASKPREFAALVSRMQRVVRRFNGLTQLLLTHPSLPSHRSYAPSRNPCLAVFTVCYKTMIIRIQKSNGNAARCQRCVDEEGVSAASWLVKAVIFLGMTTMAPSPA